jgi:hypothetical protein
VSEQLRSKFSRAMQNQKLALEKETHSHFCLRTQQQLVTHQLHYLFQKYSLLFASIKTLAYDKTKQDLAEFAFEQTTEKVTQQSSEIQEMLRHIGQVTVERDAFRDDTKSLYNTQIAQATSSGIKEQAWRGKCKRLDDSLKECMEQNAALVEQLAAKDRLTKTLAEDRDKLKKNVSRLIAKKGNIQSSTKICKNCQVEFVEKENFNWSCRTH